MIPGAMRYGLALLPAE